MKCVRIAAAVVLSIMMTMALAGCASNDYKPELGSPQVEPPTIGEEGTLRVGVNTSKSPLAGMGNDRIIGIDVDIAAALADELGLKLSLEDVGTSPDTALEEGSVDIVMGIDKSDSDAGFWLSAEYLPTGVAVFATEGSNAAVPKKDDGSKIAAQVSSKSAWAVTNAFGDSALESANDLSSAISELASGQVDYLASDAVIGMYAANRAGTPVEIVALIDSASGYCIGASSENIALQSAVADALSTLLNNGTIGVIEQKWLGSLLDLSTTPTAEVTPEKTDNADEPTGDADATAQSSAATAA
ncbi:substrate-binding periplasmic protein [Adlercreutzia murintestinalis]|uniref:substrate-binding periplasmic protein n=1 Tax=Adlercreutzia murintestinalis TaxID=2941325 RepID=UPI00203DA049|nr:transporter substrate-binding domain-containing protein [Adlercreutzia murintestinalis]